MDKSYVKNIIEGLESSSSSRVLDSLLEIRSKIITTDDGIKLFVDCGGLICLISHIRKPNEKILDLSLSILGNCCLNDKCRVEVGKLNIVPPLVSVLKTVCLDSIVGRACRVVGNLAHRQSNAEDLHRHGVVAAIVALIEKRDKSTSYPTLIMAVRALRQLWSKDKREEMLYMKSVRCIAILLTTECELAGIIKSDNEQHEPLELKKSQEELITGILKCLCYFTTHTTYQTVEQVQGDGRGYQCLVALTKKFESLALRCLMNICIVSHSRHVLGTAGFVPCLISILQKKSDIRWWPEGAARTLSQLCGESVNRARIRHSGGLSLLIAAAREHTFALEALIQYIFDDASLQMLSNAGLLNFLIDEMKKHLLTMKCEHEFMEPIKYGTNDLSKEMDYEKPFEESLVKEKTSLVKKRKSSCNKESMSVVIERDDMFIGFSETVASDASDSSIEDECPPNPRKRIKQSRSKSPTGFMKRLRRWRSGMYWEVKGERDGPSTSRSPMSPEAAPMSPVSDGSFSPEYRSGKPRCTWSPESGFSAGEGSSASPYQTEHQWSPSSSSASPTSPFSVTNEDSSDSEISGRYSPVCEEAEATEDTTVDVTSSVAVEAAQVALDELVVTDLDAQDPDDNSIIRIDRISNNSEHSSSRIGCVLLLFVHVCRGTYHKEQDIGVPTVPKEMYEQLASNDCLGALLDYMQRCRSPSSRSFNCVYYIFNHASCLRNILKNKVVLRLHNMLLTNLHPVSICKQCRSLNELCITLTNKLMNTAESNYGVGEISYQLLRGSDYMKETLSLTLPYIVKNQSILRKFFIECNALTLLCTRVPERPEEFEQYVTALAKLSTNIRIKDPKFLERRFSGNVCVSYDPVLDGLSNEEIVTFELDDASTVRANRAFLCQNSEVFNAMLMGCFKESFAETVRIKNVTKAGLEYLLLLLHYGFNNTKCNIRVFPMADKLETNLEVLLLADRFLFETLKISLNSAILQFKLTPETADKIYAWSLGEGMGFLCVESVAYLLTGKMSVSDRSRAFRNILNLEYREQWIDDIKSIIKRHLDEC